MTSPSSRTARIVTTVKPEKILIAMSGGVDSSVAALLLSEAGCECVGATMRLFHNEDAGVSREKSCCSLDARSVAYQLGMPFYVFNFTDGFGEQVMDRFVDAYERGATPNPCIDCNRYMKFAKLVERAELLGCDAVATGHYARIEQENGRWLLKKAVDDSKDQSYVLYFLNQHQLAHLRFPLGTLHKTEAREIAEKHGLVNARKRDSQDICFVPDGDYARVIELRTGQKAKPGPFVDREGHVLGEHAGIIHYTIGQRKGLGLGIEHPYYVCEKRPEDNTVVLGPNEALFTTELDAGDFNWIAYDTPPAVLHVKAKIRYRQQEQPATVTQNADGTVHVSFDEPSSAAERSSEEKYAMMISTKGRYALRVMIDLAESGLEEYVPLKEIADREEISRKYLENIMTVLSKAGLVDAIHGKGGGYRLNRRPEEYTLAEILNLTEGTLAPVSCMENGQCSCDRTQDCRTKPIWTELDNLIQNYLESVTLAAFLTPHLS